jgi:tetratricopeptide (TPR) repeat protein
MTTIDYAMCVATQLQGEGKLEQAETILNSILDVNPIQADALHLSGIIAYQKGKITLGIEQIKKAIENHPTVALFHSNLGEIYRQLNAIDLSIQYGQYAVMLDPDSATALSNLGIAYYDAKRYDAAEECHKLALIINPKLGSSLNNMGSIYKTRGKKQQAIAFYQEAITVTSYFIEPFNNLGALFLQEQEFKQAIEYLSDAIKLVPNFVAANCNMGLALLGLNQYDEALYFFSKVLRLNPDYADAYYGMAKLHFHKHNFIEAENAIHKAITLNPQQAEFYQLLTGIYCEQNKHTQSLTFLDHALSINSTLASLYMAKGSVLMEIGETSKAEEQFSKIAEDPAVDTRILAHYALVQLRKIQPNNASLKELLSIDYNTQDISPSKLIYLYFALGKCYDDMDEWAKAFSYFTQGCNLKRKSITFDISEQVLLTKKIINHFSKETIDYLRTFANHSKLPIFIVGMPRSGTTLIEQIIASHPNVYGAGELPFLNDLFQSSVRNDKTKLHYPENILQLLPHVITENYLCNLRKISSNALRITDKMPSNFIAIGLIYALFPNAKIIHVKRNAMDTCLSCYTKLFSQGHLYSYDLTELGQYYNCYESIMNHWRGILPPNAWLDIEYENVVQNLEAEAKRLIAYCDLHWDAACLLFNKSKRKVRTASFMQVRQPLYTSSVNRWHQFKNELAPLIKIINVNPIKNLSAIDLLRIYVPDISRQIFL